MSRSNGNKILPFRVQNCQENNQTKNMKIKVATLTGKSQWEFELPSSASVADLKDALSGREGIEASKQHLLFNGQKLTNATKALSD
jgi:hypothetical protein